MKLKLVTFTIFALPFFASAQEISAQSFIEKFLVFSNSTLIPFLLGLAFLFFLINVIRFFVVGGSTEDGRTKAKNLAIYGVLAFVIIVIFWGIINLLSNSLGFAGANTPTPDYLQKNGTTFQAPSAAPTPARNGNNGGTGNTSPSSPAGTTSNQPVNLLPPAFGGPAENGAINCPPGSRFNAENASCDFQ